jgi:hypothetical protein
LTSTTDTHAAAGTHRRVRRAWLLLVFAGVAIEATLLAGFLLPLRMDHHPPSLDINIARVYGLSPVGLLRYLLCAATLFAAYCVALSTAVRLPFRWTIGVLAAATLFLASLMWVHPTYSSDIFHYIATTRVWSIHGANPHVVPPDAFPNDPLMPLSGWWTIPSPYGPAWTLLSGIWYGALGQPRYPAHAVVTFKLLTLICTMATSAGVAIAAERIRPGSGTAAAIAFGWNPLVLIHLGADGHNDAAMLLLLAWGVAALTFDRRVAALVLFGVAALVKLAAGLALIVLAGALARQRRWRDLLTGIVCGTALAILLYVPFWAGFRTLHAALDEGRYFTNTPASLILGPLRQPLGDDRAAWLLSGLCRLLLLISVIIAVRRSDGRPRTLVLHTGLLYLLAACVLGTWYQPWYATWPLLFLSVVVSQTGRWRLAVPALTLGGLLVPVATNFVAGISGRSADDMLIDAFAVLIVLAPLALAAAWAIRVDRLRGPGIHGPVSSPQ